MQYGRKKSRGLMHHPSGHAPHLLFFAVFFTLIAGSLESGLAELPAYFHLNTPILRDLPIVAACTTVSFCSMWCWTRMLGYLQGGWWVYGLYLKSERKIVIGRFRLVYIVKENRHVVQDAVCYNTRGLGRVDVNFDDPRGRWEANVVDFHAQRATIVYTFERNSGWNDSQDNADVPQKYLGVLLLRVRRNSREQLTDEYEGDAKYVHESCAHEGFIVCSQGPWNDSREAEEALRDGLAAQLAHAVSPSFVEKDPNAVNDKGSQQ